MSFLATKGKFHVALDGVGLLLQGAPERPAILSHAAPVYGTRFASGDRDYNDLSQWWYLVQTDWSGGIKDTTTFADDAKFYYSSNIDARTKPGSIRLEKQMAFVVSNVAASDKITDFRVMQRGSGSFEHYMDVGACREINSGTAAFDSDGSPTCQLSHRDYMWVFGSVIGNSNTATPYPFVISNKTSDVNGIIAGSIDILADLQGCSVGNVLYVCGISDAGNFFVVKTAVANPASGADWTLCAEVPLSNNLGASCVGLVQLGSQLLILIEGSPVWSLHSMDISSNVVTKLKDFEGGVQNGIYTGGGKYLQKFFDQVLVTVETGGNNDEDGEIWSYNGSALSLIYKTDEAKKNFSTREAKPYLKGGCVIYDNHAFWGNLVMNKAGALFNFIKNVNDDVLYTAIPLGSNGTYLFLTDNEVTSGDDQIKIWKYNANGTTFKDGANDEAFLVFSQHDKLQSIDKLMNTATIGFEKFLTGQSIKIYYSTNPVPDPNLTTGGWTLLGEASYTIDGAVVTSKKFIFPDGIAAKKPWFRVQLYSGGSDTPTMTDFTLEYLPIPDYKKEWTLNINAADEVKRLDGRLVEMTGRELKSLMEKKWWTKSGLDFQDLDYATTTLSDNPLSNSNTTITVPNGGTTDFPEQGRLHIEEEEVIYTGKTPTTFTGCVRGSRGTRAASHAQGVVINNAFKVIITNIESRTPAILEGKELEYTVALTLREV